VDAGKRFAGATVLLFRERGLKKSKMLWILLQFACALISLNTRGLNLKMHESEIPADVLIAMNLCLMFFRAWQEWKKARALDKAFHVESVDK